MSQETEINNPIETARQLVASGQASGRMKTELESFDRHTRIIAQAGASGLTVHSNIHTFRVTALRWIESEIAKMSESNGGRLVTVRVAEAEQTEEIIEQLRRERDEAIAARDKAIRRLEEVNALMQDVY